MRSAVVAGLALVVCPVLGLAQESSQSGFWRGKFEIFQYNFSYETDIHNRGYVHREVDLWKEDYDLYQNRAGVVREELTHMNRNRSLEGPLDIRLLDFNRGEGLVFDRGGGQAIKGLLTPPVSGKNVASRRILGFNCDGEEYDWVTFQQAKVQLQSWSARDSDFKVPLLQIEYISDNAGALLTLRVRYVSELQPVSDLPASLFQPPAGLQVINVPSIE